MKIENFETGAPLDPNLETIYLSPKENIKNKNHVRVLVKELAESSQSNLKKNLENNSFNSHMLLYISPN